MRAGREGGKVRDGTENEKAKKKEAKDEGNGSGRSPLRCQFRKCVPKYRGLFSATAQYPIEGISDLPTKPSLALGVLRVWFRDCGRSARQSMWVTFLESTSF